MFGHIYEGRRVFVTGHTGFKGSWLTAWLLQMGAEVAGFSDAVPTGPSHFDVIGLGGRIRDCRGDVRDRKALVEAMREFKPEIVFHLAAQALVRASYDNPADTIEVNAMGTLNVLEAVRVTPSVEAVVSITSDKAYRNDEWVWGYRETDHLGGADPYSASKGCAEIIAHSYFQSFFKEGPACATVRAGNVIGGGDFANDRIVPDCVRAVEKGVKIAVRNRHSTRPYQHVLEPLFAYLMIAQKQYDDAKYAGWYNVGPDECDCVTTGDLVDLFCASWGEGAQWEDHTEPNAPHEANFLKLDCSKIKSVFGWSPRWHIGEAIAETCAWTRVYFDNGDIPAEMDREIRLFEGETI